MSRRKIPHLVKVNVRRRDEFRCVYCKRNCLTRGRIPSELKCYEHLTLDHVIPYSDGGANTVQNLVVACSTCNSRRGDRLLTEEELALLPVRGERREGAA